MHKVINEKTTKELWDKLEALHLENIRANKLLNKQRLYSLRMKEGTPLSSHINEFESRITDLENLDEMIDDENKALLLLRTLPSSFEHFVDSIVYGNDTISLNDVKDALETKEGE